ncbi:MAG: hypothetical protein U0269_14170 [Polyangiales bacterium]
MVRRIALLFVAASALSCGGVAPMSDAGDASTEVAATRELARCRDRLASAADLVTIEAVVRHINALPSPVTVPCFVASLPRPFTVVATSSVTSAQPASGARSPRLFLLFPSVTLSVVAEGHGAHLVELGQWSALHRSIKGELELPWTQPLAENAPFARVRYQQGGTSCGFCHREEDPIASASGSYSSGALRPVNDSLVSLAQLRAIPASVCASNADTSEPCLFWHALFDYGDVQQGAFDPGIETLFR